jgi:hypothetical protein
MMTELAPGTAVSAEGSPASAGALDSELPLTKEKRLLGALGLIGSGSLAIPVLTGAAAYAAITSCMNRTVLNFPSER